MREFPHFNASSGAVCPVCKTADDLPIVLIPIPTTEEDGICEAMQVHKVCYAKVPNRYMFNDKVEDAIPTHEYRLRRNLWRLHGAIEGHFLYGDDGELQCNTCGIDFRRDKAKAIESCLSEISLIKFLELQAKENKSD